MGLGKIKWVYIDVQQHAKLENCNFIYFMSFVLGMDLKKRGGHGEAYLTMRKLNIRDGKGHVQRKCTSGILSLELSLCWATLLFYIDSLLPTGLLRISP